MLHQILDTSLHYRKKQRPLQAIRAGTITLLTCSIKDDKYNMKKRVTYIIKTNKQTHVYIVNIHHI